MHMPQLNNANIELFFFVRKLQFLGERKIFHWKFFNCWLRSNVTTLLNARLNLSSISTQFPINLFPVCWITQFLLIGHHSPKILSDRMNPIQLFFLHSACLFTPKLLFSNSIIEYLKARGDKFHKIFEVLVWPFNSFESLLSVDIVSIYLRHSTFCAKLAHTKIKTKTNAENAIFNEFTECLFFLSQKIKWINFSFERKKK